jgi:dGTPase
MNWKTLLNSSRPRSSTGSTEHRSQFERDFDRCAFSTPVKRLQDKAQVFPLEAHDAVRTRLTHSLEVSSVARGLGVAVAKWLASEGHLEPHDGETVYDVQRSVETICATCGLIHDLGNPPFGHAGEYAIQGWFATRFGEGDRAKALSSLQRLGLSEQQGADLLSFDGNAQTIRLVAKLQVLADYHGLNLTWGTLSALRKYVSSSTEIDDTKASKKKTGHFASETDLVARIEAETGTGGRRNPITFLVEAADDIVYSVADVEDAVKKRVLPWSRLESLLKKDELPEVKRILEGKTRILSSGSIPEAELPDDLHASAFRTAAIALMVPAAVGAFQANYDAIMSGSFETSLIEASPVSSLSKLLTKGIGRNHVYSTQPNLKLELMGRRVIADLLDVFWEGAEALPLIGRPGPREFAGKAGALLSENYRRVFQEAVRLDASSEAYYRFQLITDYICGMTDTFSKRLHAELFNG